jgi:PAS domain S-box-containing protein
MEKNLRQTGIDAIGMVPWSTHFCQFYQTKEDLIDILVPYFKAGLENNEFCMWVTSEPLNELEAREALEKHLPDLDHYIYNGQLEILPYTEWYTQGGCFDSERVLSGWAEKLNRALARGFSGLRLTGNTFWLEKEDWKDFTDYESAINSVIGNYKMLALCTYSLDRCDALELIDVMRNHQFALIKREGRWELIETSEYRKTKEEVARLATFPEMNPNPVIEFGLDGSVRYANPAVRKLFPEILESGGRHVWLPVLEESIAALKNNLKISTSQEIKAGDWWYHLTSYYFPESESIRVYGFDITERKKQEEELNRVNRTLRALSNASQAMMQAKSESDLLTEVCRIIVEDCGHTLTWVGFAEQDQGKTIRPVAQAGFEEGYLETLNLTWADTERGRGPTGTAIRTGKPDICRNMLTDPRFAPWREQALKRGYASSISLPLTAEGVTFGALSIYSKDLDPFSEHEVNLLTELAGDLSYGIVSIRARLAREQAEMEITRLNKDLQRRIDELETIFATAPIGLAIADNPQGLHIRGNPANERMIGLPAHSELSKAAPQPASFRVFQEGRELPVQELPMQRACRGEFVAGMTMDVMREDGRLVTLFSNAAPLFDEEGKPRGAVGAFLDFTELKRTEQALRESESRWRQLAEAMPQLVWIDNAEGYCEFFSKQWFEYTGLNEDELLGHGWQERVHPDDIDRIWSEWNRAAQSGTVYDTEYRIRRHDGTYRWFKTRGVPIRDESGRILKWYGSSTDIHDLYQAQEELWRRNRSVQGINKVLRETIHCETEEEVAKTALNVAEELTSSKFGSISRIDDGGVLHGVAISEQAWDACRMGQPKDVGLIHIMKIQGIWGRVFKDEKSLIVNDPSSHPDSTGVPEGHPPIKSFLGVPLKRGDKTFGMIALANNEKGYDQFDVEAVESLAVVLVEALSLKRTQKMLKNAYDELDLRVKERTAELVITNEILRNQAALLDLAHDAILVRDVNDHIIFWNDGARETYGFIREEALGKLPNELLRTKSPQPFDTLREQVLRKGRWEGELIHTTSTGEELVVESRWALQKDKEGAPTGVLEINRDITARKLAEAAVKAGRQRFYDVLETLTVSICLLTPNYEVLFANRAFREFFGDSNGRRCYDYIFGQAAPCKFCESFKVLQTNEPHHWECIGPGNRNVDVYDFPFTDTDGSPLVLEMDIDITDRRQAEAKLSTTIERLEQSNRELDDFAFVASHDLQEPLRKIQTFGDRLQTSYRKSLDDRGLDYLARMQQAAGRMQSLILSLLDYSRITARTGPFEPVNLKAPVEEAIRDLMVLREETGGSVEIGELPIIEADQVQMRQLFQNLIGNGLKFCGERLPVVKIYSNPSLLDGFREIIVEDNGIGFDETFLEKIFKPFQRLHGRDAHYQGMGMGLAICRKIVERHGGNITAKGRPGEGAVFMVRLPEKQIKEENAL